MRIAVILAVCAILAGCGDATFQIKQDGAWADVVRIKGTGSFSVEYDSDGAVKTVSGNTNRPGLLEGVLDAGMSAVVIGGIAK